jgi:hypothetical protein
MRRLGRLGQPLRSSPGFRRRRRVWRPILVALVFVVAATVWLGFAATTQVDQPPLAAAAAATRPVATAVSRSATATLTEFAHVEGLSLVLPHHSPVAVGFHEADHPEALPLQPVGPVLSDGNAGNWDAASGPGAPFHVLPPAGTARPATSAVDVVVPEGGVVLAPVSGVVTAAEEYPLVGQTRDWRVVIEPTGRPDVAVVLRFVSDPQVAVGDPVVAGDTILGAARVLPFESPIDALADAELPRVAVLVKPAVSTDTIDPNAPAVSTGLPTNG